MILVFESTHVTGFPTSVSSFATLILFSKLTHFFSCTNSSHRFMHLSLSLKLNPMIHTLLYLISP
ncbi:hypothetical protein AMTRI_Chr06g200090 [Amborella trichopoda]